MVSKNDFKELFGPYYLLNAVLSISFLIMKTFGPICTVLFPPDDLQCELNMRQSEIMFFMLFVIVMRARKTGSTSMLSYFSSGFMYAKAANVILWFNADPRFGLIYLVLVILSSMLLPEPSYSGPENVVYFRGVNLDDEIQRDKRIVWVIAFYTVWSPSCVNFAPTFAKLSAKYTLSNLKFGKIDVGRFPDVAAKYQINDTSFSRQLPTVILFKNGEESCRRPAINSKGKIEKFFFTEDNIQAAFDFNNIYKECASNPIKEKKEKRVKSE